MDGLTPLSELKAKRSQTTQFYAPCVDQVVGHKLDDPFEKLAARAQRKLQFFGHGIGNDALISTHTHGFAGHAPKTSVSPIREAKIQMDEVRSMTELWKDAQKSFIDSLNARGQEYVTDDLDPLSYPDVTTLSREQLLECFPGKHKKRSAQPGVLLNNAHLIRVLLWQVVMKMRTGEVPRLNGNMRTAWYRHVEPLYVEKNLLDPDVGPPIDAVKVLGLPVLAGLLMEKSSSREGHQLIRAWEEGGSHDALIHALTFLNEKHGANIKKMKHIFSRAAREKYLTNTISRTFDKFFLEDIFNFETDIGLVDPGESLRFIGRNRARKVLFTEKEGLRWLCQYANKTHSISAAASRGESSLLDLYYFHKHFPKKVRSIDIGAVTDYDPWGFAIARNIQEKLQHHRLFGPGKVSFNHLDGSREGLEKLFTPDELKRGRRDLKHYTQYKQSQVKTWMTAIGGLDGKYGIHVDLAPPPKLHALVDDWVKV